MWQPRGVSFSAGGVLIIGHLGIMTRLLEAGALERVQNWYGCSGGSLCAFLGALGVSAAWIRDAVEHFDTRVLVQIEDDLIADYLNSWGINSGARVVEFFGRFADTWEPGSSSWTFADIAQKRPGISLNITATNITRGGLTVFNATKTPTVRIIDAVRASCAVPGFFTPWVDSVGDLYCDGAVLEYYPWSCVEDKADTLVLVCSETGISGRKATPAIIHSISDYFRQIVRLVQQNQMNDTPKNWIAIKNMKISGLDFHITKGERFELFSEGLVAAGRWLAFRTECSKSKLIPCGEIHETHQPCGDHCTLSCSPPSPDRMSDNPQSHSLQPLPYLSRGSHSGALRHGRRWSL